MIFFFVLFLNYEQGDLSSRWIFEALNDDSMMFFGLLIMGFGKFDWILGGELHTLSFNVSGGTGGWVCVSMEAGAAECGSHPGDCFCRRVVCLYAYRAHIQEPRIVCKCWHYG